MAESLYSEEQLDTLWGQLVEVYANSQRSFDSSVRTLSAAGVAVTVSLATALKGLSTAGKIAAACFLISLTANLVSYAATQRDVKARLRSIRDGTLDRIEHNGWTRVTFGLNVAAGVGFIAGGVLLALFIGRSA